MFNKYMARKTTKSLQSGQKISLIVCLKKKGYHTIKNTQSENFRLNSQYAAQYSQKKVNFGFNGVGELAYKRSYARVREDLDGRQEKWHETVERVVNGVFTMYLRHCNSVGIPWNQDEQTQVAQNMYDRIYSFKFLPPGRGLWAMGTAITETKHLYAALNNCAFVSSLPSNYKVLTRDKQIEKFIGSFIFLMDSSMIGVGVGFDTKGSQLDLEIHKHNQ